MKNWSAMKITQVAVLCFCLISINVAPSVGQEISVELGANKIALNQYFTVTVKANNDNIREHSPFPEIHGFVKRGTSSSSNTSFINGKVSSSHSIIQNYQATAKGAFEIRSFRITVNGEVLTVKGKKIEVGDAIEQRRQSAFSRQDPIDNFFGRRSQSTEYVDVKADAFLALSTSKSEVYVGEGFTATLAFYVSEANRADMRFFELGKQVTEIVKELKPERCWEENFNVENINGEQVLINGKNFTKYKVYQTAFFPLSVEDITFPAVDLELIKYNVAKNPSFFGRNREEDRQSFKSRPKTVRVRSLPQHPLMETVSVGDFRLQENAETTELETGQSFNYAFDVIGIGNISAIAEPNLKEDENFDFYSPNTQQNVNRSNGQISGSKSFNYYGIPNEPGEYDLGEYVNWIFFNTRTDKYDTLRSDLTVVVTGQSRKNEYILSNDVGEFYDRINNEDNELKSLDRNKMIRPIANSLAVVIFGLTAFVMFKKV